MNSAATITTTAADPKDTKSRYALHARKKHHLTSTVMVSSSTPRAALLPIVGIFLLNAGYTQAFYDGRLDDVIYEFAMDHPIIIRFIVILATLLYLFWGQVGELLAAPPQAYNTQVFELIFESHMRGVIEDVNPFILNSIADCQKYNKKHNLQYGDEGYATNQTKKETLIKMAKKISKNVWKDQSIRQRISQIKLGTKDIKNNVNKITSEKELFDMMTSNSNSSNTIRTSLKMTEYLTSYVRNNYFTSHMKVAQRNEDDGKGLFQGHAEKDVKQMKDDIVNLMAGPKEGHKSEVEATSDIVAMLEQVNMAYIWFLSVHQMCYLALQHVMFHNDHRKIAIVNEIMEMDRDINDVDDLPNDTWEDEHIDTFSQSLHRQESNELVASLDKIIKLKIKLIKARDMLMDRRAEVFELYDSSYDYEEGEEEMVIDIYVPVSYCVLLYVYLCFYI